MCLFSISYLQHITPAYSAHASFLSWDWHWSKLPSAPEHLKLFIPCRSSFLPKHESVEGVTVSCDSVISYCTGCLPSCGNPNCLHNTVASALSHIASHTALHVDPKHNSILPASKHVVFDPISLISPSLVRGQSSMAMVRICMAHNLKISTYSWLLCSVATG